MLAVEQLAVALALVFGGGVLLLLLGTQILHWYWLVLLTAAGAVLASIRLRERTLPHYRIAQIVDHRLRLSDSLSTAWFLLSSANHRDDPIARFQIERAEAVARAVKPSRAFPLTGRRSWALTGALGAVVFGLFALRYLVTSSLSLEQALVPIHLGGAFERLENSLSAENRPLPGESLRDQTRAKSQASGREENDGRSEMLEEQASKTGKQPGTSAGQPQAQNSDSQNNKPRDSQSQAREGSGTPGDKSGQQATNQASSQQAQNTSEQATAGQQGTAGLIDKMRDALSSLMAKMRPNQNLEKAAQNSERTVGDQKSGDQTARDQQAQQQQARNEQSKQDQSSEARAQGQTTERAQNSQGRNSGQSPEKASDAHSGIGRQDGDKQLKEAEQLQAMGKLAEIIGKRSASLTGDMMVEMRSGKQQLKTAYSQRLGHHADLGGEIDRDEIPLADQQYIREYMELVRKQGKTGQ